MNLFISKLTGKLLTTEKFEKSIAQKEQDVKRYREVEKSAELAELNQLKTVVTTNMFEQNKQTLLKRKYKDTPEYATLKEFTNLQKNKDLQLYFAVKDSDQLKEYLDFMQTEDALLLTDKKAVKTNPQLKKMLAYSKSKAYKVYVRFNNTDTPARFEELKKQVMSDEFKANNAFWANPKRWETTEEYKQEQRYQQLAANKDIVWFLATDAKEIEHYESFYTDFNEGFDWNTLDKSKWQSGFKYQHTGLKANHSYSNQKQANNAGKNTIVQGGTLHLVTRLESVTAPAWDEKKGFVEKKFDYTSDIIQTADTYRTKGGLIMAKLRSTGKLHHAFWLGSEKALPRTTIFHYNGKQITIGGATAGAVNKNSVSGINPSRYYIYSLVWNKNELIWYINNMEVYRVIGDVPWEDMYLAFNSWIDEKQKGSTGELEVDWVKVYHTK